MAITMVQPDPISEASQPLVFRSKGPRAPPLLEPPFARSTSGQIYEQNVVFNLRFLTFMKSILWTIVGLSGSVFVSAPLEGATNTTFPAWNGTSAFAQMGETPDAPATEATWGETFVTPVGNTVLQSFSFWLSDSPVSNLTR